MLFAAFGAEAGELEGVADVAEAKSFGRLFQGGDEAFVQTNGGAAFPADDVVMVVAGLLGKIESFALQDEALNEAGLPEGLEDSINGGAIADL